jgi:hypothetical protein
LALGLLYSSLLISGTLHFDFDALRRDSELFSLTYVCHRTWRPELDMEKVPMVKSMVLVCAAMAALSASSFGSQVAGWLAARPQNSGVIEQIRTRDPMNSEAAMRYRTCQQSTWRIITVR